MQCQVRDEQGCGRTMLRPSWWFIYGEQLIGCSVRMVSTMFCQKTREGRERIAKIEIRILLNLSQEKRRYYCTEPCYYFENVKLELTVKEMGAMSFSCKHTWWAHIFHPCQTTMGLLHHSSLSALRSICLHALGMAMNSIIPF